MLATIQCYWKLLTPESRRRQIVLLLLAGLSGLVEMVSVGLVIPFIALAANALPFGSAKSITGALVGLLSGWNIPVQQHTVVLGSLFFLAIVGANLYLCVYQAYASWFIATQRYELTTRVVDSLLRRPLEWIEGRHSADLSKLILADADRITVMILAMTQVGTVVARFLMVAVFLTLTQPKLALGLGVPLALGYWLVFTVVQRPMASAGNAANEANQRMSKTLVEILGGARELRVAAVEDSFFQRFARAAGDTTGPMIIRNLPGHFTRAGLEVVTVLVVVVLLVYFHFKDGNLANGLPLMSAYAVAGIRLLPAVQQSLYLVFEIRYCAPSLFSTAEMLTGAEFLPMRPPAEPMGLHEHIALRDVSYGYPGASFTLTGLSLQIQKNSRVAFVGPTGAGKSTLVDLILGLRVAQHGSVEVDGQPLSDENLVAWRRTVGYVPQSIFLLDSSLAENIALGIPLDEIDQDRLHQAARLANIHDFIQSLPEGYATTVGERGVRLSGGQCQRVGIARALYHDPAVVVFDEATSSLDSVTEGAVLEALDLLKSNKTLIVIAHRLNTIWDFDQIFVLKQGKLVGRGTAPELVQQCPAFNELARAGNESQRTN